MTMRASGGMCARMNDSCCACSVVSGSLYRSCGTTLPNSSRTSTQAIRVPITALIAATMKDEISVSLIAATASGSVIESQK